VFGSGVYVTWVAPWVAPWRTWVAAWWGTVVVLVAVAVAMVANVHAGHRVNEAGDSLGLRYLWSWTSG
jgi:hypothetical protein